MDKPQKQGEAEVGQCHWWRVFLSDSGVIKAIRSKAPFHSKEELIQALDYLVNTVDKIGKEGRCLLLDVRHAPIRSDPESVALVAQYNEVIFKGFIASAILVKTASGVQQASRLVQEGSSSEEVSASNIFVDEREAYRFFQAAQKQYASLEIFSTALSEKQASAFLEALPDPVLVVNQSLLNVVWQNAVALKRLGNMCQQALTPFIALYDSETKVRAKLEQCSRRASTLTFTAVNGMAQTFDVHGRSFQFEGQNNWLLVLRDSVYQSPRWLDMEFQFRKYQTVFDQLDHQLCVLALDGTVQEANHTAIDFAHEDIIGIPVWESALWKRHSDSSKQLKQAVEVCVKSGEIFRGQMLNKTSQNKDVVMEVWLAPVRGEDGVIDFVSLLAEDITIKVHSQKRVERAKQDAERANKAKSEFLAMMSHEIRTPLNGMLGMLQSLNQSLEDGEQKDKAFLALKSAKSLFGIINDILDFSKIEAGHLELEALAFNMPDLLEEIIAGMDFIAKEKSIKLSLVLVGNNNLPIKGDANRIRQIINNLISNALKFTEGGNVTVSASLEETSNNGVRLRCSVEDTGIGIPEEKLSGIFNSFTQVDASTTRVYGGTGLGLAISKRLCTLMGGEIEVESKVNKGSKFFFYIYLEKEEQIEPKITPTDETKAITWPEDIHILVVEDNPINQLVVEELLAGLGLECEFADDGEQALLNIEQSTKPYDLIFMDCQMPNMDGFEATRRIRAGEAGTHHSNIPVVALTANAMVGDRDRCIKAGMDDYLSKPIEAKLLLELCEKWLEKSKIKPKNL